MRLDLLKKLEVWTKEQITDQCCIVAYSGGVDSHVLLHALWQCRALNSGLQLRAIHIHHGLQAKAGEWAVHCQTICQQLAIPLEVVSLQLPLLPGDSIEAKARLYRYQAFAARCGLRDRVLSAHTRDDQAETVLLQLLRGSGPLGLAGIAAKKPLGQGFLLRPLLDVGRQHIMSYAKAHQLQWIEDDSNRDVRFRRNFLRHHVVPLLTQINPGVHQCIARSGVHCAESQQLLEEYLLEDFQVARGQEKNTLKISVLKQHSPLKQRALLRYWLQHNGVILPATKKLESLLSQMLFAKHHAHPCVSWGTVQIRRHRDLLYILSTEHQNLEQVLRVWDLTQPLLLGDTLWTAHKTQGQGLSCTLIPDTVNITTRLGGERCRRQGQKHSRPLKKILQDLSVPTWQRARLPLFYDRSQGILVAVGDLFLCEGWQVANQDEMGWVIEKEKKLVC